MKYSHPILMSSLKLSKVLKREIGTRTQASVAEGAGISKTLLNDWVSSRRNPGGKNFPQLLKLAKYLGLSLEELLFDIKPTKKQVLAQARFTDQGNEYRINIEKLRREDE